MALRKDNNTRKEFSRITISLASPETIVNQSHGEVLKPETINYRTYKKYSDQVEIMNVIVENIKQFAIRESFVTVVVLR